MITHPVTTYAMTQQDSSAPNLRYPAWQREFEASLHEPDPKKLLERVHAVEAAIFNRLQEWAQTSENPDYKAEEQAIAEALRTLRVLKRDKLQFPDWETSDQAAIWSSKPRAVVIRTETASDLETTADTPAARASFSTKGSL